MNKLTKGAVIAAAATVAGLALLPASAQAAGVPTPVTHSPGATGTLTWAFDNTSAAITSTAADTMRFRAPANSTFDAQDSSPPRSTGPPSRAS